jgi:hypothetical protein
MADAIKPTSVAACSSSRCAGHRRLVQTRLGQKLTRCRSWLRALSTRLAWTLVARHGHRHSYCPDYRTSLAVLLHGLARDVALSHLCQPVHCYSHAVSQTWESGAGIKRSPLLTR